MRTKDVCPVFEILLRTTLSLILRKLFCTLIFLNQFYLPVLSAAVEFAELTVTVDIPAEEPFPAKQIIVITNETELHNHQK